MITSMRDDVVGLGTDDQTRSVAFIRISTESAGRIGCEPELDCTCPPVRVAALGACAAAEVDLSGTLAPMLWARATVRQDRAAGLTTGA
jgi:hypothetical protein